MHACKYCAFLSEDNRYDKGHAKCLRHSFQGVDPHLIRLGEVCELFFPAASALGGDKPGKEPAEEASQTQENHIENIELSQEETGHIMACPVCGSPAKLHSGSVDLEEEAHAVICTFCNVQTACFCSRDSALSEWSNIVSKSRLQNAEAERDELRLKLISAARYIEQLWWKLEYRGHDPRRDTNLPDSCACIVCDILKLGQPSKTQGDINA